MNQTQTDKSSPPRSYKLTIRRKLLFAVVVFVLFFLVIELVLWGVGVQTVIERGEDPLRGFSGLVSVFEQDSDYYRVRKSQNHITFNPESFLAKKPANGVRLFAIGGSSTYGFPWDARAAFPAIVGDVFAATYPDRPVESVNMGGMSYGMHRCRLVVQELVEHEPDIFLVYSGHNEFIEPAFFNALKDRRLQLQRLETVAAHTRIYSLLRSTWLQWTEEKTPADQFNRIVERDDRANFTLAEKQAIVEEYRNGLRRLVRTVHDRGAKVVLCTIPCNLRDWRPERSTVELPLDEKQRESWVSAFQSGKQNLEAEHFEQAHSNLLRAKQLASDHAETHYLLGKAYEGMKQWQDAQRSYMFACDYDSSPSRRTSSINQAIRDIANEEGALLVDIDQIFTENSEHGLVGLNLIEDYVHPTQQGHQLIAWHIWDAVLQAGWFGVKTAPQRQVFLQVVANRMTGSTSLSAKWLYNQGVVLANQGHIAQAIDKYRQAVEIAPNYKFPLLNLGHLLWSSGQHEEAIGHMRHLVHLDPNLADGHTVLGLNLQATGSLDEAVSCFRRAMEIKPDDSHVHLCLGVALREQGKVDEAIDQYRESLRLKPDTLMAHVSLAKALAMKGQLDEAVSHLQQALEYDPQLAEAYHNLGGLKQMQGDTGKAIEYYQRALEASPDYTRAHINLGQLLADEGQWDEAVEHLRGALQTDPDNAEVCFNLANLLNLQGQDREAIEHYRQALQNKPDYEQAHFQLAGKLYKVGQLDEALQHFNAVLEMRPDSAITHYRMAILLTDQGQHDKAITHLRQTLRLNPDDHRAHNRLGLALSSRGQTKEAINHFRQAAQLKPGSYAPIAHLAWELATASDVQLRQPAEAVQLAQRAAELSGRQNVGVLQALAAAYAATGQFELALDTLQSAIEIIRSSPADEKIKEKTIEQFKSQLELYRSSQPYVQQR